MAAKAASNGGNNRVLPAMVAVQEHAIEAAAFLKSLANEQRLLILCCLLDGPLSVGEINGRVPLSQSALSQHLGVLREAGLVSTNRQSQTIRRLSASSYCGFAKKERLPLRRPQAQPA
jgi:DNA-binding transcriptional ArsR family regulator